MKLHYHLPPSSINGMIKIITRKTCNCPQWQNYDVKRIKKEFPFIETKNISLMSYSPGSG